MPLAYASYLRRYEESPLTVDLGVTTKGAILGALRVLLPSHIQASMECFRPPRTRLGTSTGVAPLVIDLRDCMYSPMRLCYGANPMCKISTSVVVACGTQAIPGSVCGSGGIGGSPSGRSPSSVQPLEAP